MRAVANALSHAISALHARLVVEANEQLVSLNQWIVQKLADRPPSLDDLF
jgi:predicted HicB family RNase H-like nuclease